MSYRISVIFCVIAFAGCASHPETRADAAGREQTRAFVGECVLPQGHGGAEGLLTGAVDAVFGGIVSGTLGRIGKALRAAGEEDTDTVIGRYPAQFEPGNPRPCVFVAKGHWSSTETGAYEILDSTSPDDDKLIKFGNHYLVDPAFFLQASIVSSAGGQALRLVPDYFAYVRLVENDKKFRKPPTRGIAFEVAVHPPGVGPKDKDAVGASMVLGEMSTNYEYDLRAGKRRAVGQREWEDNADYLPLEYTSAWFKTFAPRPAAATNPDMTETESSSGDAQTNSPARPSAAPMQKLPRTVTVTVAETRKPREFLLFLADVFDASKEELQKAAELAVLESKQTEAQLAAAQASTTLMTDYLTKLSAAEVAIINYCQADQTPNPAGRSDRLTKSSAASVAQRAANVAALAASQPQPYTTFVPVSSEPRDAGFCPAEIN